MTTFRDPPLHALAHTNKRTPLPWWREFLLWRRAWRVRRWFRAMTVEREQTCSNASIDALRAMHAERTGGDCGCAVCTDVCNHPDPPCGCAVCARNYPDPPSAYLAMVTHLRKLLNEERATLNCPEHEQAPAIVDAERRVIAARIEALRKVQW